MTTAPLDKTLSLSKPRLSHNAIFWIGFCAVMARPDRGAAGAAGILAALPHRNPDLGPAGDVVRSVDRLHRHDLVRPFGVLRAGHVWRCGALLLVSPPNLWLAILFGLAGAAGAALFVAFFSTRLRDIYFAITTLIFSQIFYVIIFTWTAVTGGENGLIFTRPHLSIPFIYNARFTSTTMHWFVLAVVTALLPDPAAGDAVAVRHGAAIDPRERAAHPRHRLSGRALQDGVGDAVRPVRRACRRALCHPERIRRARFRLLSDLGRHRDLQRHGRHRHAGRPDRRRRLLSAGARNCWRNCSAINSLI